MELPDPLIYEILCYLKADELWRVMQSGLDGGKWIKEESADSTGFTFGEFVFNDSEPPARSYHWSCRSNLSKFRVMSTRYDLRNYIVIKPMQNASSFVFQRYPEGHFTREETDEIERLIRYL